MTTTNIGVSLPNLGVSFQTATVSFATTILDFPVSGVSLQGVAVQLIAQSGTFVPGTGPKVAFNNATGSMYVLPILGGFA